MAGVAKAMPVSSVKASPNNILCFLAIVTDLYKYNKFHTEKVEKLLNTF